MGIKRTRPSGKRDALGREIKVSEQQGQRASSEMDSSMSSLPMNDYTGGVSPDDEGAPSFMASMEHVHSGALDLADVQDAVIASGDDGAAADLAVEFAGREDLDIDSLCDVVLAGGDPWNATVISRVDGANVPALQDHVISSGDAMAMTEFAQGTPGADRRALSKAVGETGDGEEILHFARSVPGADVETLGEAILATRDMNLCASFMSSVPGGREAIGEKMGHALSWKVPGTAGATYHRDEVNQRPPKRPVPRPSQEDLDAIRPSPHQGDPYREARVHKLW